MSYTTLDIQEALEKQINYEEAKSHFRVRLEQYCRTGNRRPQKIQSHLKFSLIVVNLRHLFQIAYLEKEKAF